MDRRRSIPITRAALLGAVFASLALVGGQSIAGPKDQAKFVDYAQCANGAPPSTSTDCASGWIKSILQSSNSHYRENDVTPQRIIAQIPAGSPATNRTISITYQTRKNGIHAYDSLATWNYTQTTADRCADLKPGVCPSGAENRLAIPDDPTPVLPAGPGISPVTADHMIPAGPDREMVMYGGTLTNISVPVHQNASGTGDAHATVTVTYSVPDANNDGKADATHNVQLLFGGHLAAGLGERGWGESLGSSSISGGPYHIKWTAADGASIGERDNQIQGAAILIPPGPDLEVTKTSDASTVDAGDEIAFTVSVDNVGDGTATDVTLNDPLPGGDGVAWAIDPAYAGPGTCAITGTAPAQTLSCAFGSLAPGDGASVRVASATTQDSSGTYPNTATVSATNHSDVTASATITVHAPSLTITKQAHDATVSTGDQIGFTITVSNGGPGVARNVTVSDELPGGDGLSWSMDPAVSGCAIAGDPQVLSCSLGDLASGASVTIDVVSATNGDSAGIYENTAVANADNAPEVDDDDSVEVLAPSLSISKEADDAAVSTGDAIGFTITVSNGGPGVATNVTMTDTLPTGDGVLWSIDDQPAAEPCSLGGSNPQIVSCTFGDLASGGSVSIHVTSATTSASAGTYLNEAVADADNDGPVDDSDSITVEAPALSVEKTAAETTVSAGDDIGFQIVVTNAGPGVAKNVTLTDELPSGTGVSWSIDPAVTGCDIAGDPQVLSCSFGDLAASASVTVTLTSATGEGSAGVYDNLAVVNADNAPEDTDDATVTVLAPSLTVLKEADDDTVSPGDQIGFTITVSNGGPGVAKNVTLSDELPDVAGLDWSIADQPAGEPCSIGGDPITLSCSFGDLDPDATRVVSVTSPTTADSVGDIDNTAVVDSDNAPEDDSSDTTTVLGVALDVQKVADDESVSTGDQIGFTIVVTNNGPGLAKNVALTDALPTGTGIAWTMDPDVSDCSIADDTLTCAFGDLAAEAFREVHVVSDTTEDSAGTYDNTAVASADNAPDAEGSATTMVLAPVLTIVKDADAAQVSAGDEIGFTITVTNSGAGTAKDVTVTDTLPTGDGIEWSMDPALDECSIAGSEPQVLTCSFGDLIPEDERSVHVVSDTTKDSAGEYANTAVVDSSNTPGDDDSSTTTVLAPSLSIVKDAEQATVDAGDDIAFTITVTNGGPGVAYGVTLTDVLPSAAGVSWSIDPAVEACEIAGDPQTLTCEVGDLAPDDDFVVGVVSATTAASGGTLDNLAVAEATNAPAVEDSATIEILQPSLGVTKTAHDGTVAAGEPIGFTITVSNGGPGVATNVTLVDELPAAEGVWWSLDEPLDACEISGEPQVLSCSFGTMAAATEIVIDVVSETTRDTCAELSNTVTVSADNATEDSSSTDVIVVECLPTLSLQASACPGTVSPLGHISYALTFANTGSANATDVVLTGTVPAGASVIDAGGGTVDGNTVTWQIGALERDDEGSRALTIRLGPSFAHGDTVGIQAQLVSAETASEVYELETPVSNAGADSGALAYGIDARAAGTTLLDRVNERSSSAASPGGSDGETNTVHSVSHSAVGSVDVLTSTVDSSVDDGEVGIASSTGRARTVGVNLLGGQIVADVVEAVSTSTAGPFGSSSSSAGSTFTNLRVNNLPVLSVAPNTRMLVLNPLNPLQTIAEVILYEDTRGGGFDEDANTWRAGGEVNMIHVTMLAPFGDLPKGAEIIVAHAESDTGYPSGLACGETPGSVEGNAFTALVRATRDDGATVSEKHGDAYVLPGGGSDEDHVERAHVPGLLDARSGDNTVCGSVDDATVCGTPPGAGAPYASARATVGEVSLLDGLITGEGLDVRATSTAGSDTTLSMTFHKIVVDGRVFEGSVGENTWYTFDADGNTITVVLNERTATDGDGSTSGTINAIHVYVYAPSGELTGEIIVASAHTGAHA